MNVNKRQGAICNRAVHMAKDVIEERKKQHILVYSGVPRWKIRDYKLNRYRELLEHPNFVCVFTAKGEE